MSMKPRGQKVERNEAKRKSQRAAADLTGARRSWARGASATRVAREGRVRVSTERERVRGRLSRAEPVRSSHLGGLTGGPGLSAHLFIFDLIVLSQKPLRKTLIFLKINQKNPKNKLKIISNYC
jgi:hypothetical protein